MLKLKELHWTKNEKSINGEWKATLAGFSASIFRIIQVHHKITNRDEYHLLVHIHPMTGTKSDLIFSNLEDTKKEANNILHNHVAIFIEEI